jgi:hypothetical protein
VRSARINRQELRLLSGMIVLPIGAVLLITSQVAPLYPGTSEGWFLITGSALAAVGLMLIGSSVTGRGFRLGEAVYVATPGALLAVVAFTIREYFSPYYYSQYFEFIWTGVAFLGLLWIVVGPILVYRIRTRLWGTPASQNSNEGVTGNNSETGRSRSWLTIATWFLVLATILAPIEIWLLPHR